MGKFYRTLSAVLIISLFPTAGLTPENYAYGSDSVHKETGSTVPDSSTSSPVTSNSNEEDIDSFIVKYSPGINPVNSDGSAAGQSVISELSLEAGRSLGLGFRVVNFSEEIAAEEAELYAKRLEDSKFFDLVEPNYKVTLDQTTIKSVDQKNPTWGLDRIDQRNLPLSRSYGYALTGQGVKAYVVDSGINRAHSEFSGRVAPGASFISDKSVEDCNGHGTHVAGTIGGNTYGVAKKVTLVPVRVFDCKGGQGTIAALISAINWIINDHGSEPAVANMSLSASFSSSLNSAVASLVADGVTVVVASGNAQTNACDISPASATSAITVNASADDDKAASFSNYGSCTDIYAPGVGITSAWIGSGTKTHTISGTSMASPHVAGVAARLLQLHQTYTPGAIWELMESLATAKNIRPQYGFASDAKLLLYQPKEAAPGAIAISSTASQTDSITVKWTENIGASSTLNPTGGYKARAWSSKTGGSVVSSCTADPDELQCTITGLTTSSSYYVDAVAFNVLGESAPQTSRRYITVEKNTNGPWTSVSVGSSFTCAINTFSLLYCWGNPQNGLNVYAEDIYEPTLLEGVSETPSKVHVGSVHSCYISTTNNLYCWGANDSGQLGIGTKISSGTPKKVGFFNGNVKQVSLGDYSTCAITMTGVPYCWGQNHVGQLGDNTRVDKTVPTAISELSSVKQISVGSEHACAITTTDGVRCWGYGFFGSIGDGTTSNRLTPTQVTGLTSGVVSISSGFRSNCAILNSGQARCWGTNEYGQLGVGSWSNTTVPTPLASENSDIASISMGYYTACILKTNGQVFCQGKNISGLLGISDQNTSREITSPTRVVGLPTEVTGLHVGYYHACVSLAKGAIYCWGSNSFGALGDPSHGRFSPHPVQVLNLVTVPDPPRNVMAGEQNKSIQIEWDHPQTDGRSPITGYRASVFSSAESTSEISSCTTNDVDSLKCPINQLNNGQPYWLEVKAQNAMGVSEPSTRIEVKPRTVPESVRNISVISGDRQATVQWLAPAFDGGASISDYQVKAYSRVGSLVATSSCQTPNGSTLNCTISGLINGTTYFFTVEARNVAGFGSANTIRAVSVPLALQASSGIPSISGIPAVGKTLTASPGNWGTKPTFTYQWWRNGSEIIPGATKSSYTLTARDLGASISVGVTGKQFGYREKTVTTAPSDQIKLAFASSPTPAITGSLTVGQTIRANPGSWSPGANGTSISYQWFASGVPIDGANSETLQLLPNAVNKTISVRVTANRTGYASTSTVGTHKTLVRPSAFAFSPVPGINGSPIIGERLSVEQGVWDADTNITYSWRRGKTVVGTSSEYTVQAADRNSPLTVTVTGTKLGFVTTARTSSATSLVTGSFTTIGNPTITGTLAVGKVLTANTGTWSPAPTFTYQWFRNGVAISKANLRTYTLVEADYLAAISVTVTAAAKGYVPTSRSIGGSSSIGKGTFATALAPKIEGVLKVGNLLTASTPTWNPVATFTYQWFLDGVPIEGANSKSWQVTPSAPDNTVSVNVTGSANGYESRTLSASRSDWWVTSSRTYTAANRFQTCILEEYEWQNVAKTRLPCVANGRSGLRIWSDGFGGIYGGITQVLSYVDIPQATRRYKITFNKARSSLATFYSSSSLENGRTPQNTISFPVSSKPSNVSTDWITPRTGDRAYFVIFAFDFGYLDFDSITVTYESLR